MLTSCTTMKEKEFMVFGDKELLKNCKINVQKTDELGNKKTESLLYNGLINKVYFASNSTIYKVYLSYNDSLFTSITYENILKNSDDEINHFYLEKKKEVIGTKFIGQKKDLKNAEGIVILFTSLQAYYDKENITDDKIKKEVKEYFLNQYN